MAKALSRKVTIYINGREVENTLSSLRAEMKKLESQQAKLPIGSEEYIQASLKIREIKSVIREQEVAVRGLGNEWKSTTTKVAEFANVVTGLNSAFQMIDLGIGKLKDLAKSAAELDDVYADVMKTTGLTHEQVEKLNEAFKKMDTRTSREQLNQLAYEAGKLGINSAEAVAQFVSASDKINIALGDVLGEGAMVTVGKLTNIYEGVSKTLEGKNLEEKMLAIGSAVNSLGQASTANEGYMVEFMKRLGGIAAQAGMSADQVLGYASALDQNGQAVEMSATAFMKLIQQMVKKPEEFVQAAGVSIEEFRRMMDEDMNGAVLRTLEGMEKGGGFQQLIGMFADMGLDGARAATVVSSLAKHLDQVREAQELANREMQTGSSVINEFNTKNETMQAQAEKAKKRFEEVRIELGNELYPVLIHLQKSGTVLMKGVAGFVQLIKENKAILPGLIALMANWVRMKTLAFVASGKLQGSIKSLLGIGKLQAHQMDVQAAKTLKKVAAEEQEKLKSIQMQLAIEKENLARQQNSSLIEVQRLAAITRNRVYNLEVAATNQATVATNANTAAVKAQKTAFASTPWGLIITALTSIAALTIQIVRNTSNWKVGEAIKEAGRQAGEAEGKILVLIDRLRGAKEGSEEYAAALGELKRDYPEIIQLHLNEKGAINNLEAAYKDLSAAARQSAYDRVYAEKTAEAYGDLAETVADVTEKVNNRINWKKDPSEAVKEYVRNYVSERVRLISEGKKTAQQALQEIEDYIAQFGGYVSHSHGDIGRSPYARTRSDLVEVQAAYRDATEIIEKYKAALKPDEKNDDPWGLQKKSLEELEAMLKKVNEAKKTAGSVLELRELIAKSEAITKQIEKLKPKTETITTTGTGETEAERKAREKREKAQAKAEAAWTRFSNSYEQAMSKINAKTLSGIEAIGAEIDATTQKMRTDLEAVDKNLHPEAAQMLTDLEAKAEEWKRAKIDEYIAKTNKELDKLAKSAAKTGDGKQIDKVRKATAELEEKLHSIDEAILQLTFDQATLFSKTDEASVRQLHDINEQIAAYKRLRQAMVASVFAEIAPETKRPFKKQEDNRVSLSYQENYTRALTATQAEVEKYTKALEDALAAEQEMARVARENGNLEEAEKHEKNAEAIQHETENLEELNEEAKKLAKEDAMSKSLNKWAEVMEDFGSKALSIFSNINTMLKNQAQQRLNELEDEKDDQIKVLDEQFEQGLISEEQYNTRRQELEDNYKAQALEAEKEDWRRQKAYGYSEAIINAAVAATKLWAGEGTTAYKIGMSALLAAEMATQIAAIESQPEPRAKGGYIHNNQLYRVGERGREWIASNSLLNDPATAPVIEALEAYQRGNRRALADVPMAQLNMPVATAAARELGRRTVGAMENTLLSMPTATQKFDVNMPDSGEMMKLWQELATYLKDPKNRQAVISRRTMTDFETNENFLRNIARI
jgi:TP901 family phage tail tape measure protein